MSEAATGPGWRPELYLQFADERLRPALDLLARVPDSSAAQVVDLGCGPGNVTRLLAARFPAASLTGIDGSPTMLARAREAVPECRFVLADLRTWRPEVPPTLIFSNAVLHWVPDHATLLPKLLAFLAPGGRLAVQMSAMHDAPMRQAQIALAAEPRWRDRLAGVPVLPPILAPAAYWRLLHPLAHAVDIWETTYLHALRGDDPVANWGAGSSLLPYLDQLDEAECQDFVAAYAARLRAHYGPEPDGTTLFPFRRLFLVAQARPAVE